ncbi:MAG TPA: hypothetical protein VEL07_04490 [Planctomycetota bacterium]|nr:hypothetical protein [Planctomycetota bacterium]
MRLTRSIAAAVGITLVAGCGSQGDSDKDSAATPSAPQAASAQQSAATLEALSSSLDLANETIIQRGTHTDASLTAAVRDTEAEAPFEFTGTGSVTVDLDLMVDGQDAYPNATGRVTIAWTGAVSVSQPLHTFGEAHYDVTVDYDEDCVFTDPRNGNTATIAADSALSYSLDLDWFRESDENWYIDAVSDHGADAFDLTVVCGGVSRQAIVDGSRHATGHLGYQGGVFTASKTVTSLWTVQTSGPDGSHTVVWDRPSLNRIFIVVDGVRFGPYTLAEARAICGAHIDED